MLSSDYNNRVKKKYLRHRQENNLFLSIVFIFFYIMRDGVTSVLMWIVDRVMFGSSSVKKEVIFLESRQQGYGDLLFQTPIFEALHEGNYRVSVVILKKHYPIIENNPYIENVYFWEDWLRSLTLPFINKGYVVFLGRNTITEVIFGLAFFRAKKIILDHNLDLWKKVFSENHTLAWQELLKKSLDSDLRFGKPRIYISTSELSTNEAPRKKKVAVIAGVDKKTKRYREMASLVQLLGRNLDLKLYLVGICDTKTESVFRDYNKVPYINLLNKQDYSEVMKLISFVDVVIGPEGSLIHVSTTLGIPTIVIEGENKFWEYSDLEKRDNIVVISNQKSADQIIQEFQSLIR